MNNTRWIAIILLIVAACLYAGGCASERPKPYGREESLQLPAGLRRTWAVAPVINLSGQPGVDALLQADILYQQLQTVDGLTVIPVDRVAQAYASLHIEQVQSPEQALAIADFLGCQGLIVATITQYDPYNPPKFGGSLQLFEREGGVNRPPPPDPRDLMRQGAPTEVAAMPQQQQDFLQVVGMFDASSGSVRDALFTYAEGRHEPAGPLGAKEYLLSMDRYSGFAYRSLLEQLLVQIKNSR